MTDTVKTFWHLDPGADEVADKMFCDVCGDEVTAIGDGMLFACSFPCENKNAHGHFHTYCKRHARADVR